MTFRAAFYRGTHSGVPGIYNRAVRLWTVSDYSHVEIVFSDGVCASSSFMDGGVRFKTVVFDPALWDFVDLPPTLEPVAREWFTKHSGAAYDLWGNLHFLLGPVQGGKDNWFCSEAVAESLGLADSWRYDPATLFSVLGYTSNHPPLPK